MNYLSRYSLRYPRALVYMMQASEYVISDYLGWFHRVKDFRSVEHRKRLSKTFKASLLLFLARVATLTIVLIVVTSFLRGEYVLPILLVLLAPYILGYGMLIPLVLLNTLQIPIEAIVVGHAKRILARHKGLRIAIAGSYGKTTMREVLKTVLSEGKIVAAPPGSYNTPLGIASFIRKLKGNEDVLIFELGEYYPGDVRKLCEMLNPDMGVITGVNEAHLEKFRTLKRTAETIFELAEFLKDKTVYVNGESALAKEHASPAHILYTRKKMGEWAVANVEVGLSGTAFTLSNNSVHIDVSSKLLGFHSVGPLAAAAHIAFTLGLSVEAIMKGLRKTTAFAHRLEPRIDANNVVTIDDSYNGNPDGAAAAIEFLGSLSGHRRWYVTPGLVEMGERKRDVHKDIGTKLAQAGIEKVVLIRNSATPFIAEGLQAAAYKGEIVWFDDALKAYEALPQMTVSGDVVLLQNDWPDQYA